MQITINIAIIVLPTAAVLLAFIGVWRGKIRDDRDSYKDRLERKEKELNETYEKLAEKTRLSEGLIEERDNLKAELEEKDKRHEKELEQRTLSIWLTMRILMRLTGGS